MPAWLTSPWGCACALTDALSPKVSSPKISGIHGPRDGLWIPRLRERTPKMSNCASGNDGRSMSGRYELSSSRGAAHLAMLLRVRSVFFSPTGEHRAAMRSRIACAPSQCRGRNCDMRWVSQGLNPSNELTTKPNCLEILREDSLFVKAGNAGDEQQVAGPRGV